MTVYSNGAEISITEVARIVFKEANNHNQIQDVAEVVMSVEALKSLRDAIDRTVNEYEDKLAAAKKSN